MCTSLTLLVDQPIDGREFEWSWSAISDGFWECHSFGCMDGMLFLLDEAIR